MTKSAGGVPVHAVTVSDFDGVAQHARSAPDRLACIDCETGAEYSYHKLDALVDAAAGWLANQIDEGARLAWLGRNSVDMLVAHLACSRSGRIFVPLNWRLAAPELSAILADCEPAIIVAGPDFRDTAADAAARAQIDCRVEAGLGSAPFSKSGPARDPEQPCLLLYTSGTTGRPKGVIHNERSIYYSSLNLVFASDRGPRSRALCDAPLFHVIGLLVMCRASLAGGGTVLMSAGFDPAKTLSRLSDATHYCGVPQMIDQLRQRPEFSEFDGSRLVSVGVGGAPSTAELLQCWHDRGLPLLIGFGMSEIGGFMSMSATDPAALERFPGSCGRQPFFGAVLICDDDGADLPPGQPGEIWVRGPTVTPGYWRRPDETAALFRDGWMRTGDIGSVNEQGFHFIVDRKKDMFISGGENVYPAEIESVIAEMPGVVEVAVVGVPNPRWGEVACAFVVGDVRADEVIAACARSLAKFKVPAHVIASETIPRNGAGKPQKHILRAIFEEGQAIAP